MKKLFLNILFLFTSVAVVAQTNNMLSIPNISTPLGQAQLPVVISNTDEIVAVQFDLTLPNGISAGEAVALTNRVDGHTATARNMGNGIYRVVLFAQPTKPLLGQSGTVMNIPITIPESYKEGSVHELAITNAVLTDKTGANVLTLSSAGSITISKLPDLTVKSITADKTTLTPDDHITVSWQVENVGDIATSAGWTEQISFIGEDGTNKLIASTYYDQPLSAKSMVSRQTEIALPKLLGIHGNVRLQIRVVPNANAGESASAQGNNTLIGNSTIYINKVLTLELSKTVIDEGSDNRLMVKLNRSGSWSLAESFNLSATTDSRIVIPSSVTIPAGQSGTIFYIELKDDDVLQDNDSIIVELSIDGNDYAKATQRLTVVDNELPTLSISASKSDIMEGETFQLTITASRPSSYPIIVTLNSETAKRFSFPSTVTIPAGEASVTVDVTAVEDEIPSTDLTNAFTASASRYQSAQVLVILHDNDLPVLELTLTPNKVSESAGVVSIAGILKRTTNKNSKITVKLSDDADGGLYFGNRTLELAKGVDEVHFNFGPVDNAEVDGDRTYTITAAVWLSSCSCSAAGESAGSVTAQLQVFDDDGPALKLTSSLSTVKEGDKTTLTITRNTATDNDLMVTLSSDYDDNLTYNHTITIPASQKSVEVEVTSAKNDASGDTHTVVFTVQTDGYSKGTCYIMVTDQTLPDAVITDISVAESEVEAGGVVTVNVTVKNGGTASLPKHTQIDFFISGSSLSMGALYTTTDIASGESETMTKILRLPTATGDKSLCCIVNNSREINELLYTNNTSNYLEVTLLSPYRATIACDKKIYIPGDTIYFTGKVEGTANVNANVEIYLINDGSRQTLSAVTDSEGKFSSSYYPYEKQMGHFVIGACYPGEEINTEQGGFDYIGLRRTSQKYITCEVLVGTPYHGTIEIENPSSLPQHNIRAEVLSLPENCSISFRPVSEIAAGGKYSLNYTIEGSAAFEGKEWKSITVSIISDEGASTEVSLYCYCRLPEALLSLDVREINTTVTKGSPRDYPIFITNNGAGETGRMMLSLPSYIQTAMSQDIASIKPGETATIILRLTTTADMVLNVPFTGQIGINCENGNGIALPFTLLPVAETKGNLIVDVCDEYTYYTEEASHVKGAKVIIKYPNSDEVVAIGDTDDNGLFSVELSEGYYTLTITADKHESYQNNLLIAPGRENKKVVNLSYEGITVNWNVEETEVEDEYEITSTVTCETNVPVPVVVTELPEYIPVDSMAPGESKLFYATLTNKGLIAAESVQLVFPETEYLTFEPLIEFPIKLLPQQAVVVPFRLTLDKNVPLANSSSDVSDSRRASIDMGTIYGGKYRIVCEIVPKTLWFWICGSDHQKKWYPTSVRLSFIENCHLKQLIGENGDGNSEEDGIPDGRGGFLWLGANGGPNSKPVINDKECLTCMEVLRDKAVDELIDMIPYVGCRINAARCAKDEVDKAAGGQLADLSTLSCLADGLNCVAEDKMMTVCASGGGIGLAICEGAKILKNLYDILKDLSKCMGYEWRPDSRRRISGDAQLSFAQAMDERNTIVMGQIESLLGYYRELFGDESWIEVNNYDLWSLLRAMTSRKSVLSISELAEYKPENISEEQFATFINRVNNSFFFDNNATEGRIDFTKIKAFIDSIDRTEESISQQGYSSTADMWLSEYTKYQEILRNGTSSVCASVSLEVRQTLTMNRPAYRGTLTVYNGNEDTAMTDVRLNLVVKNEDGNIATSHEFQINAETLEGFEGEMSLPGNWTLDAKQTGKATILFFPTKYAAPTTDKVYSFGGTLTYIDPFTGLEVTRSLIPVSLTVRPLPDMELTYFMQRDVYGDDPLTTDVVESMQPAEFALIINNKGNGDANNVRMQTEQPKIIDNEKGLFIDFNIKSSQVNGEAANLSFGKTIANSFDTIPAHSQAYAQWWLESSLLGHFTSYDVEATHITSYGNEDLSLLDTVTIHEMIHGFTLKRQEGSDMRGFLVNDITDAEDMPDQVYFTDATQQNVVVTTDLNINKQSETEYVLSVNALQPGWNYGSRLDPTNGRQKLVSVVRQSDGQILPIDNVWQTDRTLRDGRDWLYENRLHFVGEINNGSESYLLTFEPKPDLELAVESYGGLPGENEVLKKQLTELTVKFNKPIVESSFTKDDITLNCQGEHLDVTKVGITKVSDSEYRLALNEVTLADGYYVLTVQTAGIEDTEGFNGATGKQVSWIQYVDGMVALKVTASPVEGGTVTPTSGRFAYDSNVTLKATPAEGYDFVGWRDGDMTISTDREFAYHLVSATELKALFSIKHYNVTIGYDPTQGTVEGAATGIYEHGTQLQLTAVPATDYEFDTWMIGDDRETQESSFILTVNRNMDVSALFKEKKEVPTCLQNIDGDALRINIEPLPLSNYMYITGNFKEIRNVFIYDIRGIKVLGEGNVQSGQGIYVGKLNKGIYYMQIATDRGVYRTKVLKK